MVSSREGKETTVKKVAFLAVWVAGWLAIVLARAYSDVQ